MSSQKVRKIKRTLNYTATWLAGVFTVTTETAHFLTSTDLVSLSFNDSPQELNDVAVTVTSGTAFTIALADSQRAQYTGKVIIGFYGAGSTGKQAAVTLPRGTADNIVVQGYIAGAGATAYTIYVSLDGVHWIANPAGASNTFASDGDTKYEVISAHWAYMQIDITTPVVAAQRLYVLVSD